jgi:hypothetical protein
MSGFIPIDEFITELQHRKEVIKEGAMNPQRDYAQTQLERGKYIEICKLIKQLQEKAAEITSR